MATIMIFILDTRNIRMNIVESFTMRDLSFVTFTPYRPSELGMGFSLPPNSLPLISIRHLFPPSDNTRLLQIFLGILNPSPSSSPLFPCSIHFSDRLTDRMVVSDY